MLCGRGPGALGVAVARHSSGHAKATKRASANSTRAVSTASSSSQQARVMQLPPSGQVSSVFAPTANSLDFSNAGVPGLGFDFPHLAAIGGPLGNNFPTHLGNNGQRGQGYYVPIFFGGYPYYADETANDQADQESAQQPQPQQQTLPEQQDADAGSDAGNLSASVSESQGQDPVPDIGDFILVRRDGRILFASVFSVVGTQLHYVTPEGIRRTLAMADLDSDATQQMNEARGTTLQFNN